MKTKSRVLLTMVCAVLLVVVSVMGTLAYLTDQESVTNTFTVGRVGITLEETSVDMGDNSQGDGSAKEYTNLYHLLPGHTYVKDPTVTVDAGSEAAYVRMMVKVEGMESLLQALPKYEEKDGQKVEIEANKKYYNGDIFLLQMLCFDEDGNCTWDSEDWKFVKFYDTTDTYEFRYKDVVAKSESATKLDPLFTYITVPGELDNTTLAYLDDVEIIVTAHAIQAAGFESAEKAWTEFK